MTRTVRTALLSVSLCIIGAGLALVSLYEHTKLAAGLATGPSFCDLSEAVNCGAVNSSNWASFLGIPVASYGLFFYLGFALLVLVRAAGGTQTELSWRRALPLLLTTFGVILSIVLFAVSKFIIGSLCLLCIGMYAVNLCLFALAFGDRAGSSLHEMLKSPFDAIAALVGSAGSARDRSEVRTLAVAMVLIALVIACVPSRIMVPMAKRALLLSRATPLGDWQSQPVTNIATRSGSALETDYTRGPDKAPIRIVEFLDFECPACRHFYRIGEELEKQYKGKISITLKNFPLDQECNVLLEHLGHKFACLAAQFTRCAGEQGAFWKVVDLVMHTEIFEGDRTTTEVRDELYALSSSVGVDKDAMQECMASPRQRNRIMEDIQQGAQVGVEGTPAIWVNGKKANQAAESVPILVKELLEKLH